MGLFKDLKEDLNKYFNEDTGNTDLNEMVKTCLRHKILT